MTEMKEVPKEGLILEEDFQVKTEILEAEIIRALLEEVVEVEGAVDLVGVEVLQVIVVVVVAHLRIVRLERVLLGQVILVEVIRAEVEVVEEADMVVEIDKEVAGKVETEAVKDMLRPGVAKAVEGEIREEVRSEQIGREEEINF